MIEHVQSQVPGARMEKQRRAWHRGRRKGGGGGGGGGVCVWVCMCVCVCVCVCVYVWFVAVVISTNVCACTHLERMRDEQHVCLVVADTAELMPHDVLVEPDDSKHDPPRDLVSMWTTHNE